MLTPDMQNRRIINQLFAAAGVTPRIWIEANSIIALVASVASGRCMAVLPKDVAEFLSRGQGTVARCRIEVRGCATRSD